MTYNKTRYALIFSVHTSPEIRSNADDARQAAHREIKRIIDQEVYHPLLRATGYQSHGDKGVVIALGRLDGVLVNRLRGATSSIAGLTIKEVESRDRAALRQERADAYAALETRTEVDLPSFSDITTQLYGRPGLGQRKSL